MSPLCSVSVSLCWIHTSLSLLSVGLPCCCNVVRLIYWSFKLPWPQWNVAVVLLIPADRLALSAAVDAQVRTLEEASVPLLRFQFEMYAVNTEKKKQHFYLLPHNRFCVCKYADLTFVCSQALGGKVTLKIRTFNSEVSVCSTSSIPFFFISSSLVFLAVSVPLSFFFSFHSLVTLYHSQIFRSQPPACYFSFSPAFVFISLLSRSFLQFFKKPNYNSKLIKKTITPLRYIHFPSVPPPYLLFHPRLSFCACSNRLKVT